MATPHDSLVKRVFTVRENAIGELRSVLPAELLEVLDLERLEIEDGSFVDPELVQRHLDLLYSVPLVGGRGEALVYVLFEHQSSDDPLMAFRMLQYMVRVWEHYVREHEGVRELPLIVPLVLYHNEGRWQSPTNFHELFPAELVQQASWAGVVPGFRFLLDDISVASDEELQARQMSLLARLALWLLRDARFDRLQQTVAAWNELFAGLQHSPGGREATTTLFCYIHEVGEHGTVEALAAKLADPDLREVAMTSAEQLRQEGREKGREEGRTEGRVEGLRSLLLKQLELKFKTIDEATRSRVAAADEATLDRYGERVLTAETLAEVLAH